MPHLSLHTPVGDLTVFEQDGAIVALDWGWAGDQQTTKLLAEVRDWLHQYFDGSPAQFDLPLAPVGGSAYRKRVWHALCRIQAGTTCSYGALAAEVGGSARAVGGAVGANPIPILIPCHRVLAATGTGGYSGEGGIATKRFLLALEGADCAQATLPLLQAHAATARSARPLGDAPVCPASRVMESS